MEALEKLRARMDGTDMDGFLAQIRWPVLLARSIVSGELARKPSQIKKGRAALVAMTHLHVESDLGAAVPTVPLSEEEQAELVVRPLARPMWVALKKAEHTPRERAIAIGRTAACDVVINDYTITKMHAAIAGETSRTFWVVDLGSTNGTWVDGTRIALRKPTLVHSGQSLQLGRLVFQLLTPEALWAALGGEYRPPLARPAEL